VTWHGDGVICVFSSAQDESTTDVLRWLRSFGRDDVIRVNHDEPERVGGLHVTNGEIRFTVDDVDVDLSELEAVWYRKGRHWLCNTFRSVELPGSPQLQRYLEGKLRIEQMRLAEYVHSVIEQHVACLGTSERSDLNKLLVLRAAHSCGLSTPDFTIATSTHELGAAVARLGVITKAISDGLYLFDAAESNRGYYSYTERITADALDGLPGTLSPSLLQVEIAKQCDVRTFYLDGRCYSMAIFSQRDDQTEVDFRRYNDERPNRTVPYRLPTSVERRLCRLFERLRLDTGSADLIRDTSGGHVFLEINPVGQFGMVSAPCNYALEREVARRLAHA
jgi:ATP-GRASP peptide maturase of grasp-with-spasm system